MLYNDFVPNNPPFSGGERDAINCVQLYRATHDKKHLGKDLDQRFEHAFGRSLIVTHEA